MPIDGCTTFCTTFVQIEGGQPLVCQFYRFRGRMHITLRDGHVGVAHEAHDREGIGAGFTEARPESMPQGVEDEVGGKAQKFTDTESSPRNQTGYHPGAGSVASVYGGQRQPALGIVDPEGSIKGWHGLSEACPCWMH